ncbi:MAG TPA: hypothetical protein VFO31_08975 [Vicinamibacterales bacterium]|nr:hypothetical protein [Vicinamibacterales bacterium]
MEALSERWTDTRIALAAAAAALCLYLATGSSVPDSHDTTANAQVPVSLLHDGDFAVSPREAPLLFLWRLDSQVLTVQSWQHPASGSGVTFGALYERGRLEFAGPRYFMLSTQRRGPDGEPLFVGAFGPATGLLALPAAALLQLSGARIQLDAFAMFRAANWTAALLVAGSVGLVFLAAAALTTRLRAALIALIYAAGSCVWTISAHALWQQTGELFFLSLAGLCLIRGESAWIRGAAAGVALSAAAACRPTAALVALAALGCLWVQDRRAFGACLAGALPIMLAVLAYNAYYFGSPFDFGQLAAGRVIAQAKTGSSELWQTPLWTGAAGLLLSPSRGLFVYSPFFAAAPVGALRAWKHDGYVRLRFLTLAVPLLWLPAFLWFDWWGGWTYGYRPIVDSLPLLALLCVPALDRIAGAPAWKAALAGAAAWSVLVQLLGVLLYAPAAWNARAAADIDRPEYRSRLWSVRDSQIGFLIAKLIAPRAP